MTESVEDGSSTRTKRKEYRDRHKQQKKEFYAHMAKLKVGIPSIEDIIIVSGDVDMRSFRGTEAELADAIERLYSNDGRDFDPKEDYPPWMLYKYGKDYAFHARGIYYRYYFSEELIVSNRKVWTPSLPESETQSLEISDRQARARTFADHSKDNGTWCKSEYAWEADAWSDVFRQLRDDPCVAVDKHEYMTLWPDTHPVTCHLTGTSTFVRRTPDATFGLATFMDRDAALPVWTSDLHRDRLERLMLHPKYGLISDPGRLDINLSFPFMVYEAKGWSGDCRVARRQACSAAAVYLDMLDHLARRPGQVGSPRLYQTETSHHYQVFVLTSFGDYWHLLVGYSRPRLSTEHAGVDGMSETVHLFQQIWSGSVREERAATELLSLIDQIHLWAITEYRTFVLEHLRPWHQLCEENYLLEWDSKYDLGAHKKRKRVCNETEDLMVPDWVADMQEPSRRVFQSRVKSSLEEAIQLSRLIKGKFPCEEEIDFGWTCMLDGCESPTGSGSKEAFLDHLRRAHTLEDRELAKIRWCMQEDEKKRGILARQKCGITAAGRRWPGHQLPGSDMHYPFEEPGAEFEEFVSNNRSKRYKASDSVYYGPL